MLFNSAQFIFFFTGLVAVYFSVKKNLRPTLLLIASYVFYMAWQPEYVVLILISTVVDFIMARKIEQNRETVRRRLLLYFSLTVNLSILFFFKYYMFVAENLTAAFGFFGTKIDLPQFNFLLPIGISFYTFQTICYTVDVYNKKIPAEKSLLSFALYVSFFPQLIAGPIERAGNLLPQLKEDQSFNFRRIGDGLLLMIWGLFLKVVLADNIGAYVDSIIDHRIPINHGLPFLTAIYAFLLQLFLDFSGYSIIAIGAAKVLGIRLMKNFNAPYTSRNIAEFWHRWHISLSTWFRDYVFYPFYLFLERKRAFQKIPERYRHPAVFFITILVTDVMLGFWHGAQWGYGLFGLYHANMVAFYYFFRKPWNRLPDFVQLLLTFQIVAVSGIFFRIHNLNEIYYILRYSFTGTWQEFALVLIVGVFLWIADKIYKIALPKVISFRQTTAASYIGYSIWVYGLIALIYLDRAGLLSQPREFIYFQF